MSTPTLHPQLSYLLSLRSNKPNSTIPIICVAALLVSAVLLALMCWLLSTRRSMEARSVEEELKEGDVWKIEGLRKMEPVMLRSVKV